MAVSLVAAALLLLPAETSINMLVVAGLVVALGAVVDDVVVDVERHRGAGRARAAGGHGGEGARAIGDDAGATYGGARPR